MMRLAAILMLSAVVLAACDKPKPRNPPPEPPPPFADRVADLPPLRERPAQVEWQGRTAALRWNAAAGAFEMDGKPLRTARLWTFDNSTDGFTGMGAELSLEPGGGVRVTNTSADPVLLSPTGLATPGGRYPLVLIRLTRAASGGAGPWSAALFYFTGQHGAAERFRGLPQDRRGPAVGETMTLVYDMTRSKTPEDWAASQIEQIRFDTEDAAGGEFVIHQIAIAAPDGPAVPPAPPAAPAG